MLVVINKEYDLAVDLFHSKLYEKANSRFIDWYVPKTKSVYVYISDAVCMLYWKLAEPSLCFSIR